MRKAAKEETQTFSPERGEVARRKLIEAGLKVFSDVGYEAAVTRDIAAAAGVNMAAISYYFRSKEGLYHAVIDHIIEFYRSGLSGELGKIKAALKDKKATQAQYRALLDGYIGTMLRFTLQPSNERAQVSHIYIREQLDPTSAFDRLFVGFIRDAQDTMGELVARVMGIPNLTTEARLIAQTVVGQISVFKLSQATTLHNMGWKKYGEKEIVLIQQIILANVDGLVHVHRKKGSK